MGSAFKYSSNKPTSELLKFDQWGSRLLTSDPSVLLFEPEKFPIVDSIFDTYNVGEET